MKKDVYKSGDKGHSISKLNISETDLRFGLDT
jgi:hypothetical protein